MPAQLPVEIIGRVIQALYGSSTKHSPNALLPLLYVSPTFRAEAERLIYAHLHLRTLKQIVRCFTTLKRRPALAKFTRSLSVSVSLNSSEPFACEYRLRSLSTYRILTMGYTQYGRC